MININSLCLLGSRSRIEKIFIVFSEGNKVCVALVFPLFSQNVRFFDTQPKSNIKLACVDVLECLLDTKNKH